MEYEYSNVKLAEVTEPKKDCTGIPVALSDETMEKRKNSVISKMKENGLDALVIYGDLEHGSNFEYLTGFLPRFEEALLVLHANGSAQLVLGNENLSKGDKSRIKAESILCSYFSLPNQPMQNHESFQDIIAKTGISGKKIGLVGWKNFTSRYEDNKTLFDAPAYIVDTLKNLCGADNVTNECAIFIGGEGARIFNNPNEIAHYEFGASLASDCMLNAMDALKLGTSEMEIAGLLEKYGQRPSVVTICSFGPRFVKANMYPTPKTLQKGENISLTIGYKGGLSSRSSIAVENEDELPSENRDYFEKLCAPYFTSIQAWLENVHVGMNGGDVYALIENVLPKEKFGWKLCPGHTTADEEWMSSPIYEGSTEKLQNGSLFQTDIIPSIAGYPGTSVESTCALADAELRRSIEKEYPEMWKRMQERREYILNEIGIKLSDDVLPMCSTLTYMRPLALSKKAAVIRK